MRLTLEMTLSREEFLRLLPGAVGPSAIEEMDGVFSGGRGPRRWVLRLMPMTDRLVGSVTLPRHQVELCLDGHSEEEMAAFLNRFHRGFQRGGG